MTLLNQRIRVFQQGGFKYEGRVLAEDTDFVTILDDRSGKRTMLAKHSLQTVEVVE